MSDPSLILAIDQGTTSTRALVIDQTGHALHSHQIELQQFYPGDGWVEHDANEIWQAVLESSRHVTRDLGEDIGHVKAIGITNQRETTVIWNRATGKPVYNAIVWQDRRTAETCKTLKDNGHENMVTEKTGLLLDPYFSATKIAWILDHVDGARDAANNGELAFGTIDSFLLWNLTGGNVHATDATNASRTMLFNIQTQTWDDALLELFKVPKSLLPEVRDSAGDFGITAPGVFDIQIPVTGMAGDQQAASIGQACFTPGMIKSTYGTGCFVMLNTGDKIPRSRNKLLATVAYRLNGHVTYALEGSIFMAGAAVQWLRDEMKLIEHATDSEAIASTTAGTGGVYLVPAFTGLGAPYWNPDARAAIVGMTRGTGRDHIVRATLEAVAYQTRDLIGAMMDDSGVDIQQLRVDGGMSANNWLMQFLADTLNVTVERPKIIETTVLGAAYLAALGAGMYSTLDDVSHHWGLDQAFSPTMTDRDRETLYQGWQQAVGRVIS